MMLWHRPWTRLSDDDMHRPGTRLPADDMAQTMD